LKKGRWVAATIAQALEKIIARLNDEVSPDDVVFVEGIRDSNALRLAGFRGRIVTLNRRGGERALVDEMAKARRVFLLLDLDEEGERMMGRLMKRLSEMGFAVDTSLRETLRKETLGRVRRIEEIPRWLGIGRGVPARWGGTPGQHF
jgi:5S rRNA maturation endonuclease (ribonuclease M5)